MTNTDYRLRDGWFPADMIDLFEDELNQIEWNPTSTHFRTKPEHRPPTTAAVMMEGDTPDSHSATDPNCACPECNLAHQDYRAESFAVDRYLSL